LAQNLPLSSYRTRKWPVKSIYLEGKNTMKKVNAAYPAADALIDSKESSSQESFILKSIAASFAGASIPAVIFYFLI
jgi:hypothetical protein